jgi:hypothetical protein
MNKSAAIVEEIGLVGIVVSRVIKREAEPEN